MSNKMHRHIPKRPKGVPFMLASARAVLRRSCALRPLLAASRAHHAPLLSVQQAVRRFPAQSTCISLQCRLASTDAAATPMFEQYFRIKRDPAYKGCSKLSQLRGGLVESLM